MKYPVHFASLVLVLLLVEWSLSYHPDFSWQNSDAFMTGDLRLRMSKKTPTRRRYCDCSDVEVEDRFPVCASISLVNPDKFALYANNCLFKCSKVRHPHISEVDIAKCGTHTFEEFKQSEFLPHY